VAGLIDTAVRAGRVPGVVAAAGAGQSMTGRWAAGYADTTPGGKRPIRSDTTFDLASLTKVVATATAVLALAGAGEIGLDEPVAGRLPRFTAGPVTVRHLLTHTSGLPGSRKFHRWCGARSELLDALYATPLEVPPGSRVVYSDPGFMVLGEFVAAVAGAPFAAAVQRLVLDPLGLAATAFNPPGPPARFAATERRDDGSAWTGTVHDENTRILGGAAGHAGLFGTAADLARFAGWWVSDSDAVVPAALRREAAANQTAGLGGRRGLGWACRGDPYDVATRWPPGTVSHTGFTGTSLALDPETGAWAVLLTNAVHFGRDFAAVKALRRDFHAALAPVRSGGTG
jgi:CubicO group peptidase (beta-lactamase class C family)